MSDEDKITTVDIITKVIDEHEKIFASLVNHLDSSIDRMTIQKIQAKNKPEKEENVNITTLENTIKELENQIEKYEEKVKQLDKQMVKIKNNNNTSTRKSPRS